MMRALPPSGVPITCSDVANGFRAARRGNAAIEELRERIKKQFGVSYCYFASSGRAALSMLLKSIADLYPGRDEVLLPAFTSFSVPSAVVNAGLKVSLYDLDGETLSPNLESLNAGISDRTLCVVVCHLYGYPCDMDAIQEITRKSGIPVIDDAAQAMGATYRGRKVGTIGDAGLFSLSRGKNITAIDGGIVVTSMEVLAEKLAVYEPKAGSFPGAFNLATKALLLSALLRPRLYWLPRSLPFLKIGASIYDPDFETVAFSPFQAGIAAKMLERLDAINNARKERAGLLISQCKNGSRDALVRNVDGAEPVYLRLPLILSKSKKESYALGIVKSYPLPLNEIEELRPHLVTRHQCPIARLLSERIVTLPTHTFIKDEDLKEIATWL